MSCIEQIAGYDYIKSSFSRILNQLDCKSELGKAGVNVPTKILIYGEPDRGKFFMAKALADDSKREYILIDAATAMDELMEIMDNAKPEEKYCFLIRDLEGVEFPMMADLIEACENHGMDIFVVAVLNSRETSSWPYSGVFEKRICVHRPEFCDNKEMTKAILSSKSAAFDVNIEDLASLISSSYGYRGIEYIINEAVIKARINGLSKVSTSNIVDAYLHHEYDSDSQESYIDPAELERTAYHEAGHAAIAELLNPGCVGFMSMFASGTNNSDIFGSTYRKVNPESDEERAIMLLASVAAVDIKFHVPDLGTNSDIERAIRLVRNMVIWDSVSGLDLVPALSNPEYCSNEELFSQEITVHKYIEEKLAEARTLLMENRSFFEAIAEELLKKHYVLASDIQRFREQYL